MDPRRRTLLKTLPLPLASRALNAFAGPLATTPTEPATTPTPALAAYEQLRFGCSFHFGLPNFTGDDYDVGSVPATTYNPTHLDVRQWIRVAHDLGAKYAVLTAKYMSGFCLWDAKDYDYDVPPAATKPTSCGPSCEACNEYGLKPGFYYCILDPHNEGKFDWDTPGSRPVLPADQAPRRRAAHALSEHVLPVVRHHLEAERRRSAGSCTGS